MTSFKLFRANQDILCVNCLLNKTCQHNMDYQCIEVSSFFDKNFLNKWQLKVLLVNCEIALSLSDHLDNDPTLDIIYNTIDYIQDNLNMSIFEDRVLIDHITLLKAFLGLNNKNRVFESAYQFYHLYNRLSIF